MINFSTMKSVSIPEGKVKKIVDESGKILWWVKLLSIAVTTPPTKTEYKSGEVFDPAGMVITATYSNGEQKVVTNYTVLNGDKLSASNPTVTISYTEDGVTVTTAYEVGFGHPVLVYGGRGIYSSPHTVTVDGNAVDVNNAFAVETLSNAAVTITSPQTTIIKVNGETVVSGVGEYTLDLSDVTHVQMTTNLLELVIATHNIAVTGEDVPVTVTGVGYMDIAYIKHNGITYTSATRFTAKTGDLIFVYETPSITASLGGGSRYYLVKDGISEILIAMSYSKPSTGSGGTVNGSVGIREVPEGHALVQITGSGGSYGYGLVGVTIDGTNYTTTQTIVVPVGTVITCSVVSTAAGEEDGYVKVNGTNVLSVPSGQGTYDYTVTGNVTINMSTVRDADKNRTGYIVITEQ